MKAIVVLSHLMDVRGELSIESRRRAKCAYRILRNKEYDSIVTLGWAYRHDSDIALGLSMKEFLIKSYEIDPGIILTDTHSRDTVGDALFSKLLLLRQNITLSAPLIVITSFFHLERARYIFKFVYGNLAPILFIPSGSMATQRRRRAETQSLQSFYRTFLNIQEGNTRAIFDRLLSHHPYYNGQYMEKDAVLSFINKNNLLDKRLNFSL